MLKVALVERLDPDKDRILTYYDLGGRWSCHPKVAYQRVLAWGLPVIKFNKRAHGVRLSDVLRAEAEASA
jgi:hypothetical protein